MKVGLEDEAHVEASGGLDEAIDVTLRVDDDGHAVEGEDVGRVTKT